MLECWEKGKDVNKTKIQKFQFLQKVKRKVQDTKDAEYCKLIYR